MSNHNGDDLPRDDMSCDGEAEQLTAYALGQLRGEGLAAIQARLAAGGEADARELQAINTLAAAVTEARGSEPLPEASPGLRERIEKRLAKSTSTDQATKPVVLADHKKPWWRLSVVEWCVIGGLCCALFALLLPPVQSAREAARRMQSSNNLRSIPSGDQPDAEMALKGYSEGQQLTYQRMSRSDRLPPGDLPGDTISNGQGSGETQPGYVDISGARNYSANTVASEVPFEESRVGDAERSRAGLREELAREQSARRMALAAGDVSPYGSTYTPGQPANESQTQRLKEVADAEMRAAGSQAKNTAEIGIYPEAMTFGFPVSESELRSERLARDEELARHRVVEARRRTWYQSRGRDASAPGTEQYEPIIENRFVSPVAQPLSTFSIDVDTASYANVRRFLTGGRLPPPNSVRIEELVNYFRYEYPQPKEGVPFSVNMEVAECPWREGHWLLRVGLKGKEVHRSERPASNLVFLLDVSGSMADQNKLPLLKTAMKLLVGELGENDRVAIVTYAGEAGLKLPPTRGHQQERINRVIDLLSAGGSTNGSAGIELAYQQAAAGFIPGGTNRVILCTDGDLNVGITSDEALVQLIKQKAAGGTFLTVLGFGEGNLKDAKMEKLADNGNGLYAYIDSVREARRVLVEQLTGSTITIAKDVKIQIEFNPAQIAAYRLLGYENRIMAAQDFNNDKKDAGEIGAGHTVTALYELVPAGVDFEAVPHQPVVDPLKYQPESSRFKVQGSRSDDSYSTLNIERGTLNSAAASGELLTLKLRYKEPEGETSKLLEYPLKDRGHSFNSASVDFQFAAAVASFGMILRGSEHRGSVSLDAVAEIASAALGKDPGGYRAEFLDLVRKAQSLANK